jgi:hypothetical protein
MGSTIEREDISNTKKPPNSMNLYRPEISCESWMLQANSVYFHTVRFFERQLAGTGILSEVITIRIS